MANCLDGVMVELERNIYKSNTTDVTYLTALRMSVTPSRSMSTTDVKCFSAVRQISLQQSKRCWLLEHGKMSESVHKRMYVHVDYIVHVGSTTCTMYM